MDGFYIDLISLLARVVSGGVVDDFHQVVREGFKNQINFLVSKFQIERSGTFQNNQRLRVFVLFQFSTTWLINSIVKGSATDE